MSVAGGRSSDGRLPLHVTASEVGFVGTTAGMTGGQLRRVQIVLMEYGPVELHLAGRPGADEQVVEIADRLRLWRMLHPSDTPGVGPPSQGDVEFPAKKEAQRFRDIVDAAGVLVAAPATGEPTLGSWTWWTVSYAQAAGRPVVLVRPDGTAVRREGRRRS